MKAEPRSPLWALTVSRLREFRREPGAIFWTFGFPILLTMALGIAFRNQGPQRSAVGVLEGPGAAAIEGTLHASRRLAPHLLSPSEANRALATGRINLLVVPEAGGRLAYRYDPTRPEAFTTKLLADDALQRAAGRRPVRPTRVEAVRAPGARYIDWLVPGLLGMQLLSGSLWGIAWTIVQTRQRKLLKRLLATPMRRRDYLLSHMLSRLVALALEVPVLLAFAYFAFGVAVRGSLIAVAVVCVLGALSFAGLGLLCAARAQNSETANGLVNLVTLPMFVLSGVFFSSARFPSFMQPAIRLLPLTALNEALRALINQGQPLAHLGFQLAVLAAWGLAAFGAALKIFRWS